MLKPVKRVGQCLPVFFPPCAGHECLEAATGQDRSMATSALRIIHGLPANSLPAPGTGREMHRECTGVDPFCTLPGPAGFQDGACDEGLMFRDPGFSSRLPNL
jgi:hypothetical protein